jgi:acetyltransferase
MVKFHQTLSDRSVYLRYFEPLKLDERVAHERLSRVCFVDYDRDMVLVAEHLAPGETQPSIIGVGRLNRLHGTRDAEFALMISDQWQGRKLGQLLLQQLVQIGRAEGLRRISAIMLGDNREMQHVARKCGFQVERMVFEGQSQAELIL